MTTRRDFLRRITRTAVGLYVAEDLLEEVVDPRRYWAVGADLGSPAIGVDLADPIGDLTGLMHEIFVGNITNSVARSSLTAQLFRPELAPVPGHRFMFSVDLSYRAAWSGVDAG